MDKSITLSDCTFAWLRREVAAVLGVNEQDIVPDTRLDRLLPPARRRQVWLASQRRLGLELPALELPPIMVRTGWLLSLGSGARAGLIALLLGAKFLALPLAVGSAVALAALYRVVTAPWRTELPGITTFGDLSAAVLARNMAACRDLFGLNPTRDEIYAAVSQILVQVGADPNRITPETPLLELVE